MISTPAGPSGPAGSFFVYADRVPASLQSIQRSVTRSVDAPAALAPVMGELFAGIDAMGSMPRIIARELEQAGIRSAHRVLDLACGKGAVAVQAARMIGCRVLAIDLCAPFITSARALADRRGVAGRCRFNVGDVSTPQRGRYDAAVMIGLYPLDHAATLLRARTKRGGVYIVDDCWWDDRLADPPNAACFTRRQSFAIIESMGDRVERIVTPTPSAVRSLNARLYAALRINVNAIARERPKLRRHLGEFLANQRAAHRLLGDVLRPAIWIVRRA